MIMAVKPVITTDIITHTTASHDKLLPDYFSSFGDMIKDWWENAVMIGPDNICPNGRFLMALSLIGLFIIAVLLIITFYKSVSNIRNTSLRPIFIFTWIYGFLIYDIGMSTGEKLSLITNAPMAIIYAFKIFLLDSDVSQIQEPFHENWLFSGNFALVHFLAACVTTLFLIKHFGFNLISRLKMRGASLGHKTDDIYVLWGLNDATYHLADSINRHYRQSGGNKSYRIIIVRTNHDDDDRPENRTGLNRILDFLSMKNSELDSIQKIGCLTTGTYADISLVDKTPSADGFTDILGGSFRLQPLRRILRHKVREKIHMLFLSDNEKENLHAISLLMDDKTLNDFANASCEQAEDNAGHQVIFYCHARYNSVHRVIEDRSMSERMKVKVVDSSHINVEMLKQNRDLLPVSFVDVNKDATVSSAFNALVVGFSEVGQDSVRFLYEFGAFVKTGSTDGHVERSDFHMHVVDKNMADLAGVFVANAPAVRPSLPFVPGKDNPEALITLNQMDCRSVEFYLRLEEWVKDLNYAVIATDDDELNISLGIRIMKAAARYRKDMRHFCILVRAHSDNDGHISKIASHYNRLWLAQEAISDFDGKKHVQNKVRSDDEAVRPIHIFGLDKEIYTYANIIDDTIEKQAIEFKERYEASSDPHYTKPATERDKAWYRDIRDKMRITNDTPSYYPSYCGMMSLRRMQGQDFANCLHSLTKNLLAQKALKEAGIPEFDWQQLSRKHLSIQYTLSSGCTVSDKIIRIINVLAQTEHLRWNASHEILGYIDGAKKNEVRMQHNCLTAWQNLDPTSQSYDYNVVDVTLNIINPERPIQE